MARLCFEVLEDAYMTMGDLQTIKYAVLKILCLGYVKVTVSE
jgi:hypothetical protein